MGAALPRQPLTVEAEAGAQDLVALHDCIDGGFQCSAIEITLQMEGEMNIISSVLLAKRAEKPEPFLTMGDASPIGRRRFYV